MITTTSSMTYKADRQKNFADSWYLSWPDKEQEHVSMRYFNLWNMFCKKSCSQSENLYKFIIETLNCF